MLRSHSGPSAVRGPTEDGSAGGRRRGEAPKPPPPRRRAAVAHVTRSRLHSVAGPSVRQFAHPPGRHETRARLEKGAAAAPSPAAEARSMMARKGEKSVGEMPLRARSLTQTPRSHSSLPLSQQHLSLPTLRNCVAEEPPTKSGLRLFIKVCEISGSHAHVGEGGRQAGSPGAARESLSVPRIHG